MTFRDFVLVRFKVEQGFKVVKILDLPKPVPPLLGSLVAMVDDGSRLVSRTILRLSYGRRRHVRLPVCRRCALGVHGTHGDGIRPDEWAKDT
jgi:hypothetical protein